MADIEPINRGVLYILDKNGCVLTFIGDPNLMPSESNIDLSKNKNYFYDEIKGEGVIVSYTASKYSGWHFVSIMPTAIFLAKVNYIRTLTLWIFGISLVLGLVIAFVLAYKNYSPIKAITKFLSERIGGGATKYHNEYDFMQYILNDVIDKNDKLKNVVGGQMEVLKYYFPMDLENSLIQSVKAGDKAGTLKILNDIFEKNLKDDKVTVELVRCLFFDLMCTAVKIVSIVENCNFDDNLDPALYIQQCETIAQMKEKLISIYERLSDHVSCINRSRHDQEIINRISKYIKTHYSDNNLSLSTISEAVSLTPSYISRFFKEQTGMSVVDYINSVRIEKAKQLLCQNQDMLINNIARQVGYTNDVRFIKNFKKYKGTTPGKYRDIILHQAGEFCVLEQNYNKGQPS